MKYNHIKIPKEFSGNPLAGSYINALDKKTAQKYFQWYMSIKDERIKVLEEAVKSTEGFENWLADFTKRSVIDLQSWFEKVVEKRSTTEEEKKLFMLQYDGTVWEKIIKPPEWVVTDQTRSLDHDVGIYFSEVLLKGNPNLSWGQDLTSKRSPYLNYPLVRGYHFSFNGHGIIHGSALKILEGKSINWEELYERWDKFAKEAASKEKNE